MVYEAVGCQKPTAVFAVWRLTASASVKVGEFGVILDVSAVLANVQFNVVSLAFVWFLVNVESTGTAFDIAFEFWIRKCFVA